MITSSQDYIRSLALKNTQCSTAIRTYRLTDRIKSPETNPYIYSQMIFNKGAMATQQGKESIFQHVMLKQLDIHIQRNELRPLAHTRNKN